VFGEALFGVEALVEGVDVGCVSLLVMLAGRPRLLFVEVESREDVTGSTVLNIDGAAARGRGW